MAECWALQIITLIIDRHGIIRRQLIRPQTYENFTAGLDHILVQGSKIVEQLMRESSVPEGRN